jgi:hypothetical protein
MPNLLKQTVQQYLSRHSRLPSKIVVDPLALVALGLKKSVTPRFNGIPVECREIAPTPGTKAENLGIHLVVDKTKQTVIHLEAFDC